MQFIDYATPATLPSGMPARLARLLALDPGDGVDDVALARSVSNGLPPKSVTALSKLLGRASVVGPVVPEATLRRIRKSRKPLPREHSERIYELGRVVDAVSRAWHGDEAAIRRFLAEPHPLLGGATPYDMARSSSAGADAVLNLIRRAEAGVAV